MTSQQDCKATITYGGGEFTDVFYKSGKSGRRGTWITTGTPDFVVSSFAYPAKAVCTAGQAGGKFVYNGAGYVQPGNLFF